MKLNFIKKLFGHEVLVAASEPGEKSPIYLADNESANSFSTNGTKDIVGTHRKIPKIEQLNINLMKNKKYVNFLQSKNFNFSIVLGEISNNICTIDLDEEEFTENFLSLNKFFNNTLTTKAKRGKQIWFRSIDTPPSPFYIGKNDKKNQGEFRSTGWCTVFSGIHPEGVDYKILNYAKPIEIKFEDITWPSDVGFSRFYFSGKCYNMQLLKSRKCYKDVFIINKKMLDCDIDDYNHLAVSYLDINYEEIFRYDVLEIELKEQYQKSLNNPYIEFERYFELPEKPWHLWIEPYSKTKSYRPRIKFNFKDIKEKNFSLQEKINANWVFC